MMNENKCSHPKRPLIWIMILVASLTVTGCWSAHEIHDIAITNVMGIDVTENGDVEVSTVIIKPDALFNEQYGGGVDRSLENKYRIQTATGKTLFEAIGKLSKSIPERIYFGHVNVVVFGEQAAREKITSSIDYFRRENEFRPNIHFIVTKGKATDLIRFSPDFNITMGLEIMNLLNINRFASTQMIRDVSQFSKAFSSDTTDPITAVISPASEIGIETESEYQKSSNNNQQKNTDGEIMDKAGEHQSAVSLNGTAVFKDGKLKGFLNERETRGLLWITGDVQNDIVLLDCEGNNQGSISVKITNTKSQLRPDISGDNVKMTIDMYIEADIGEVTCPKLKMTSDNLDKLNQQLEDLVKKDATIVLNKVQKNWQADIFGFGEAIYRKYPRKWEPLAKNWKNGGLKHMEVDLNIKANISRYGLLQDPSSANESR